MQNVDTDRRHDRRALLPDETSRLIQAAENGPIQRGVAGGERALIYRVVLGTGLRASELASVTVSSFVLDGESPTVTIEAANSKRRRRDVLPLRADLVVAIKHHFAKKEPAASAFTMPKSTKTAPMIRSDLKAARKTWIDEAKDPTERENREKSSFLAYRDELGRVADFHALRHTFVTNLASSGVHPKEAQQLARHSTITLTLDRYTHLDNNALRRAVEGLPTVTPSTMTNQPDVPSAPQASATGDSASLAFCLALGDGLQRTSVDSGTPEVQNVEAIQTSSGLANSPGNTTISAETKSGSAWESNPPVLRLTQDPAVLKTVAATRRTGTSKF